MIQRHIEKVRKAICGPPNSRAISLAASVIISAKAGGGTVWTVGNGGSAAMAQHFAQDLLKACGVPAQAINDVSVITAYANDVAFSKCYEDPLRVLWKPSKDAVFVFSCSGKSRNVESLAREFSPCVAIVGTDGGALGAQADVCIHANSMEYDVCETAFSVAADLIVREVMRNLKRRRPGK